MSAVEHLLRVHGLLPSMFASIAGFHSRAKLLEAACLIVDIQPNGAGFDLKRQLSHSDPGLPVIFIK